MHFEPLSIRLLALVALLIASYKVIRRCAYAKWKERCDKSPATKRILVFVRILFVISIIGMCVPFSIDMIGNAIILWCKIPHGVPQRPHVDYEAEMVLYSEARCCRWRYADGERGCNSKIMHPPIWYTPSKILDSWPFENVHPCIRIATESGEEGWVGAGFLASAYLIDAERSSQDNRNHRFVNYLEEITIRSSQKERLLFNEVQACLSCADGKGGQEECGAMPDEDEHIVIPGEKAVVLNKAYRLSDHMPCLEIELEDGRHGWILGLGEDLQASH